MRMQRVKKCTVSTRADVRGMALLRGLARFHKQSISEYVHQAIKERINDDLHRLNAVFRMQGYDQKRSDLEFKKLLK